MAHFLHGYDYKPEYTAEKVKARLFLVPPPPLLFVYHRIIIILFIFCFVRNYSNLK